MFRTPYVLPGAFVVALAVVFALPKSAAATVRHTAELVLPLNVPVIIESLEGVVASDITEDLELTRTGTNFNLTSKIGRFGSVAMRGEVYNFNENNLGSRTTVRIGAEDPGNLLGVPQRAMLNFIIDGGSMSMLAFDYRMNYRLTVSGSFRGANGLEETKFESTGELVADFNGSQTFSTTAFSATTEDIGAIFDPVSRNVEIPLSFQSVDLGIVPAGESIDLFYRMEMSVTTNRTAVTSDPFVEFAQWQFSDPANLGLSPVLMSVQLEPVPEPGAASLFALGLAVLAVRRRRRATVAGA